MNNENVKEAKSPAVNGTAESNSAQCGEKRKNGKGKPASGKQFVVVVFIMAIATKMFILPIYLIQSAGRDGYIVLAISSAIELIMLVVTIIAMQLSKERDFFALLTSVVGKVAAKIIVALFAVFLFFKINVASTETITFYSDTVLADFDSSIMAVVLLVFLVAVANSGLRALCRLNEIITPIIVIGITGIMTLVIITGTDLANIFPAMQNIGDFKYSLVHHLSWMGDFTPLVLFLGRTEMNKKRTAVAAGFSGLIGLSLVVFQAMVMCSAFGNVPTLVDSSTNISGILQYTVGNVYGRVDMIAFILWSLAAFVETAMFFYATVRCVEFVIGKNEHFWVSIGVGVALFFTLVFGLTDPTVFEAVMSCYSTTVISPVFTFGIPMLALVCALILRHRDKRGGSGKGGSGKIDTDDGVGGGENNGSGMKRIFDRADASDNMQAADGE